MSFQLYPPGDRNKRHWVARIVLGPGDRREKVLDGCKTKSEANLRAMEIELELRAETVPGAKENITFKKAAELYVAQRDPVLDLVNIKANLGARAREEARRIARLFTTPMGSKFIREIVHADFVAAANQLYGSKTAQTKNREVMRPCAAIYHYAERNGYCPLQRFSLFKEPRAETRAVPQADEIALHEAVPHLLTPTGLEVAHPEMRELMMLWLFRQGGRISQTLSVTWDHIDLQRQVYKIYNKKAGDWQEFQFDPEVFERLAAIPAEQRHGRLWPWSQKTGVYRWTRQLRRQAGVRFTPHMARHTVGTAMHAAGTGTKAIGAVLGHLDVKSTLRYTAVDLSAQRAAHEAAAAQRKRNHG